MIRIVCLRLVVHITKVIEQRTQKWLVIAHYRVYVK